MMKIKHAKIFIIILFLFSVSTSCATEEVKKEPFDAEKYLQEATSLIKKEEYEEARKLLFEISNRDYSKKYAPLATIKIAETHIKEGNYELGIEEYKRFLEIYPTDQYAPYVQYSISMTYYNMVEDPERGAGTARQALLEFLKLKELFPRNPYKEQAEAKIEKCKNIIADGEFIIGKFYYKKDSFIAALGRFEGLLKEFPLYLNADETLFLIGKSYIGLKNYNKAKETFNTLIERYPNSKFADNAKKISFQEDQK